MAGERTYPILPCRELDDVVPFYEALGFAVTYRQQRPNPYAVVRREDLHLHFAAIAGFDPAGSYASVIVTVPDADGLYADWAAGLRAAYGRVPAAGIPRLLRPRRKQGTATGFSLVDPGGNWIRVYRAGEPEETGGTGLERVVRQAARYGDAKGDDAGAAAILDRGLARHPEAPPADRAAALAYRAELAHRLGDPAASRYAAEARAIPELTPTDREALADL